MVLLRKRTAPAYLTEPLIQSLWRSGSEQQGRPRLGLVYPAVEAELVCSAVGVRAVMAAVAAAGAGA